MEGLQHRLLELARTRTQGRLAETPGDAMALTSQVSIEIWDKENLRRDNKKLYKFCLIFFLSSGLSSKGGERWENKGSASLVSTGHVSSQTMIKVVQ